MALGDLSTDVFANEEAAAKRAQQDSDAANVEKDDLQWLMSSMRGRRIVWRMLSRAGVYRISFNTNALTMAFQEGNRNQGNLLLTDVLNFCPEYHAKMLEENQL